MAAASWRAESVEMDEDDGVSEHKTGGDDGRRRSESSGSDNDGRRSPSDDNRRSASDDDELATERRMLGYVHEAYPDLTPESNWARLNEIVELSITKPNYFLTRTEPWFVEQARFVLVCRAHFDWTAVRTAYNVTPDMNRKVDMIERLLTCIAEDYAVSGRFDTGQYILLCNCLVEFINWALAQEDGLADALANLRV